MILDVATPSFFETTVIPLFQLFIAIAFVVGIVTYVVIKLINKKKKKK